jgi:hypothetical protein
MPNEADTYRRFVVPKLQQAGWDTKPDRLSDQGSGFPPVLRFGVASRVQGSGFNAGSEAFGHER